MRAFERTGNKEMLNKEILTLEETAEYLNISLSTIKKWAWMRFIPVCKLGEGKKAPIRVRKKDLDDWLEKKVKYNQEIDNIPVKTNRKKNISKSEDIDEFFKSIEKS